MPIYDINTNTESDTSHPPDGFSVVRFAVRIPIVEVDKPASLSPWRPKPSSHDDDDDDDDGGIQDTQCFELCFHPGFVPNPDPISLHMLSSGRIEHHDPAPVLRTPRPPCYIHELPDLIDLTDTVDDATSATPVALHARSTRPIMQSLLTMLLYTVVVLSSGLILGRRLHPSGTHTVRPHPRAQRHEAAPSDFTSFPASSLPPPPPPHATYVLDIDAEPTIQALSLYNDVLPLERLHLAAEADVAEVMATDPDLGLDCELNKLVSRVCRDVSFLIDNELVPSVSTPATIHADIKLTCQHIFNRFLKLHRPLRDLKATSPHNSHMDTKLSFAAWMLDTAVEGGYSSISLPQAYAKSLLDPDREVWQQCRFCSSSGLPPVDIADWHFACDPSFFNLSASLASRPAAAVNNYFTSWGKHQSARRFAALRNSPLDVDDTPLYPNNQHPFDEADDIHTWLPNESPLNSLLRNIVETATAVDELLDLLGALNVSAVSGSQANDTKLSLPEVSWWRRLRSQPRSTPLASGRRDAIRQGTARLAQLQNDLLTPLVRSLGRASASMAMACAEADRQRARIGRLAAGRDWERPTAHIVEDDGGALSSTNTVTVHVARTVFTADIAAEASVLHAELAERLAERQSAAAAAKATATISFLASRELAAAATTTTLTPTNQFKQVEELGDEPPLPPMSEEDLAFEQRVQENLDDDPLSRLAALFRGG
ncbi:hypothetical protein CTA2_2189 [Colletotrichum tanaceti]|uniref:Uncharacterized protein n=1 Tax=Colletotrichum tanaceti TaxID=1306861 RepID=A0A4U6XI31_9PEZI|nr:hypothetical protein CTA2_2194 [Colletotrichum tanaceti]KAJ0167508.1 hypothetical protein CTA2_2189 [Colletotrichum tanaceti]TKW55304.1 hypothetical protein CTA1_952 [Colletotrichum tanaceti]